MTRWAKRARALRNLGVCIVNDMIAKETLDPMDSYYLGRSAEFAKPYYETVLPDGNSVYSRVWMKYTNVVQFYVSADPTCFDYTDSKDARFIGNFVLLRAFQPGMTYLSIRRWADPLDNQHNNCTLRRNKWLTERLLTFNVSPTNDLYRDSRYA